MVAPSMPSSPKSSRVELFVTLIVIAIVAILLTLLFPSRGGGSQLNAARKTQAKNDATQIATAITAYVSQYGHLPTRVRTDAIVSDGGTASEIMDILCPPNPNVRTESNSLGLTFLEIPKATKDGRNGRLKGAGPYLDPWGQAYFIALDGDGDWTVLGPGGGELRAKIHKQVLVWSRGDPKRKDFENPAKWIKSWE